MAAPHVAGAAALLRSSGRTVAETDAALKATGNLGWSGDPDGTKEPLVDVRDAAVFSPTMVGAPPVQLAFTGGASAQKSSWTATVTVSGASPGAAVSGAWSIGGTPNACTAGADGRCTIVRSGIAKRTSTVTWTHTASGTKVVIAKP
jgi:hypothetical protein